MTARKIFLTITLGAGLLAAAVPLWAQAQPLPKTTLDTVMAAFNEESNARARFLAFAQKADEDGYGMVASLFRAGAEAERIHMEKHAAFITSQGAVPKAALDPVKLKTTQENLEETIKYSTTEAETMYPEFSAQAKKDGMNKIAGAFKGCAEAEKAHLKWYKTALDNLQSWKGDKKDFFVCPVCGYFNDTIPGPVCPVCMASTKTFVKVN